MTGRLQGGQGTRDSARFGRSQEHAARGDSVTARDPLGRAAGPPAGAGAAGGPDAAVGRPDPAGRADAPPRPAPAEAGSRRAAARVRAPAPPAPDAVRRTRP